jgi:hypothetical protein
MSDRRDFGGRPGRERENTIIECATELTTYAVDMAKVRNQRRDVPELVDQATYALTLVEVVTRLSLIVVLDASPATRTTVAKDLLEHVQAAIDAGLVGRT